MRTASRERLGCPRLHVLAMALLALSAAAACASKGVECRKDLDVIDETPGAYKSIDAVMAAQTDLVDIVHTLRQVVCVKG
jgi:RNA-splicing ligase RtcB